MMWRWMLLIALFLPSKATVSSDFSENSQNWTVRIESADGAVQNTSGSWSVGGVSHTWSTEGNGAQRWWFVAPQIFLGDQTAAYGGTLQYSLAPLDLTHPSESVQGDDVVLVAKCGHSLRRKGVVSSLKSDFMKFTVKLSEKQGQWIDSRTGRPPSQLDFLGTLRHLDQLWIRGSIVSSNAATIMLSAVSLESGTNTKYPCCTPSGKLRACSDLDSHLTPPSMRFPCEGSWGKLPTITTITPKFSRRSGGATITISGTYLGLAGSRPVVRINGWPCQESSYLNTAGTQAATATGPAQQTQIVCVTPQGSGLDQSVVVETFPGSLDAGVPALSTAFETGSVSCTSSNAWGFQYGGYDFDWVVQLHNGASPYALTGNELTDSSVAVDGNTGEWYHAGTILSGVTYTLSSTSTPTHLKTSIACSSTLTSCGFVAKLSRDGQVAWATTVETDTNPGAGSARALSVAVDASASPKPRVYVVGLATGGATAFTVKVKDVGGTWYGEGVDVDNGVTGMWIAQWDSDGGYGGWMHFVTRCVLGGPLVHSYPCPAGSQSTNEAFNDDIRIAVYRSSAADMTARHTKTDHPLGIDFGQAPRDNGGVYVAGTVTRSAGGGGTARSFTFFSQGVAPNIAPTATPDATSYPRLGLIGAPANPKKVGFLLKYDDNGNAQWVRAMGADVNTGSAHHLVLPTLAGLAVANDVIVVAGWMDLSGSSTAHGFALQLSFDSCEYAIIEATTTSHQTLAENLICGDETGSGTSRSYADDLSSETSVVTNQDLRNGETTGPYHTFIVAYDASGLVQWVKDTTKDDASPANSVQAGDDFRARAVTIVRPLLGGAALAGHVNVSETHSAEGRSQPNPRAIADDFYVYVGGDFLHSASTGQSLLGKLLQFPNAQAANAYMIFLFKLRVSDGATEWVSWWGDCVYQGSGSCAKAVPYTLKALAADDVSGEVFVAGVGQANVASPSGFDAFYMAQRGMEYMPGCSVDPSSGLSDAQTGRSRCLFTSTTATGNTGFLIKVGDAVYDGEWNVIASQPNDIAQPSGTYTERPGVQWVKTFGVSTTGTTSIEHIAYHDGTLMLTGHYANQNAGTLAFEGVSQTFGVAASESARLLVQLRE